MRLCLFRLAHEIQYPSESVEICSIIRLLLYDSLAHLISLFQVPALLAQIICIIIENIHLVRCKLQGLLIRLVCLLFLA